MIMFENLSNIIILSKPSNFLIVSLWNSVLLCVAQCYFLITTYLRNAVAHHSSGA